MYVQVMRDIMGGQGSNGDPGVAEARNTTLVERHGPVERVINITFEEGPAHTDETQVSIIREIFTLLLDLRPHGNDKLPPRLKTIL